MKIEHITILIGLLFGFILLTLFIRRALNRALGKGFSLGKIAGSAEQDDRYNALNNTLGNASLQFERVRTSLRYMIRIKNETIVNLTEQLHTADSCTLSKSDLQVLNNIASTLDMACRTWAPIHGTEPHQARAKQQLQQINAIAERILAGLARRPAPAVKGAMHSSLCSRGIVAEGDTQIAAAGDAA